MKRVFSKIALLMIVFLCLGGCNKVAKYDKESDINKGYVVAGLDKSYNTEKLKEFSTKVKQGEAATINIVQLTIEGDPIYLSLIYDGSNIIFKQDNSKDKHGKTNITEDKVNKDNFYERENKYYIKVDKQEILLVDSSRKNN